MSDCGLHGDLIFTMRVLARLVENGDADPATVVADELLARAEKLESATPQDHRKPIPHQSSPRDRVLCGTPSPYDAGVGPLGPPPSARRLGRGR